MRKKRNRNQLFTWLLAAIFLVIVVISFILLINGTVEEQNISDAERPTIMNGETNDIELQPDMKVNNADSPKEGSVDYPDNEEEFNIEEETTATDGYTGVTNDSATNEESSSTLTDTRNNLDPDFS